MSSRTKKRGRIMPGYHKTKSGKMAKKGLYYNINQKKKSGTSKSKSKSTISDEAYSNMKAGFPRSKRKKGLV
tara:strand:+ start:7706 stop:7921 length:216 start_codon:yes stop_codon:yes gene_type:complete